MAEKNTLSILETIKKKMHKLDQKSEDEKKIPVDGDDFQYISSGKKIEAAQTSEIKSEPLIAKNNAPKFEDDLGLDTISKPVEKIANAMPAQKTSGAGSFDDFNLDDLDLDDEEKFPQKPVVKEVLPTKAAEVPLAEEEVEELEDDEDYLEEFEEDEDYEEEDLEEETEEKSELAFDNNAEGGGTDWLGNPVIDETPAEGEPTESLEKDIDEELNLDDEEDSVEEAKKEPEHAEEDDLDLELEEESEEHDEHEEEEEDDIDLDLEEEHEEDEKHDEAKEEHEEDLDLEDLDLEEEDEIVEEKHHEESHKDLEPFDLEELEEKEVPKKQEEKKVVNNDDLNFDDLEFDEELETPKSQAPMQTPVNPLPKQEPAPQKAEMKKPDPIKVETVKVEPAKVESKKVEEPQVEVKKEMPSFKQELVKDPFMATPLEEKHEVDIEFEKEIMGLKPEVVKHAVNTMPPLQQNNVSTMNQTAVAQQDLSLRDSTMRQVNDSVRKLIDAKNVISGISSFSQGSAFSELAAQLMEPKLEKWFNQNLPELVEKIVREEIKKIIPKE